MSDTGHGGAITLATSGMALDIISIVPPEETVEDVELPHLGLDDGDHVPYMPADLVEGGELSFVVAVDPDYDAPLRTVQNVTLTYPIPSGMDNGATWIFSGYVKGYAHGELKTSERMEATITVKVAGNITKADASNDP